MMAEPAIKELFSETWKVGKLPKSLCRNCKRREGDLGSRGREIRLYKGRWYHVEMGGGEWFIPSTACGNPMPMRCKTCGGRIDYRTNATGYYGYECEACVAASKKTDKIGDLTKELRRKLSSGKGDYLKYGTSCSVVLTRSGIFFEDIC